MLDGAPYKFTGMNVYNANSVNNFWYTLGTGSGLDTALAAIGSGIDVIRAWFGQWLLKPTGNTIDWGPFDHTVDRVKSAGKKLIVVFGDQDGLFDDGIVKRYESNWYQSGYETVVSNVTSAWGAVNTMTYKDFVLTVVDRYKNEPAILMWQLVNEVEPKRVDGTCDSTTNAAAAVFLQAFADDMSSAIKTIDPYHLVSLGTIGTGQCGGGGGAFQTIHEPAGIDLCEMHDYVPNEDIIGDEFNGMALRLQQSATLNKPLFVGEMGIDPSAVGGTTARANRFASKLTAQFSAGIVGIAAWEWRNAGETGGDQFVIDPGDPVLDVMRISNYTFTPSSTLYDFESSTQGWVGEGGPSVARVTTPTISGTGCLAATKTLGAGFGHIKVNDAGQIPDDLSGLGDTVGARILLPANAVDVDWVGHLEVQDSSFAWIAQPGVSLARGAITQLSWTPPAGLLANCRAIGVTFWAVDVNATQTVYVDSIQIGTR
jgi:mannan endo-1,4-beta-mannosidase